MRKILFLVILVLIFVAPAITAVAADLHCGRDTDRNGSVDNYCAGKDQDFDGYDSVADGGTDCDDTDWKVYPGMATGTGCSAGQAKMCQSSGSFTSCAAISSAHCPTGTLAVYFVDDAETDCTGTGTSYADPENYLCWFDTGKSGYHALTAGDCVIMLAGTYSDSWSSAPIKQIYSSIDGTSSNPITIMAAPGESVLINGAGSSPNTGYPVYLNSADYWNLIGFEVDGNFTAAGVYIAGANNASLYNLYVRDLDSTNCGSDNCGGIKKDGAGNNLLIRSTISWNNYNRAAPTNLNNSQLNMYRGTGHQILYSVFGDDVSGGAGFNYFYKHCIASGDADTTVRGNIFSGGYSGHINTNCGGMTIDRNVFINPNSSGARTISVALNGGNGAAFFQGDTLIENNTSVDGAPIELHNTGSFEQMTSVFTADSSTDIITMTDGAADFPTDDEGKVMVTTTTTLPAPLVASTYYYLIRLSSTTAKLATSLANAQSDTAIDLTDAGSGTHTIWRDFGSVTVRKNIFRDTRGSAYSSDGTTGIYRLCHYCVDTAYDILVDNNKFSFSDNAHYNSNAIALYYTLFGDATGTEDLTYSSFASWTATGQDAGSLNSNPNLDADNIAQATGMETWGWRTANEAASGGSGNTPVRANRFRLRVRAR